MDKRLINYFVDIGMLISFILVLVTGIFKFPGWSHNFGFVYDVIPGFYISRIHDYAGLVMGGFVLIHIIIHWRWLVSMTTGFFKSKNI